MYKLSLIFSLLRYLLYFLSAFFSRCSFQSSKINRILHYTGAFYFAINAHTIQKMLIKSMMHLAFNNQLSKRLYSHTLIKLFIDADRGCEHWLPIMNSRIGFLSENGWIYRAVIVIKWLIEFEFCFVASNKGTLSWESASRSRSVKCIRRFWYAVIKWLIELWAQGHCSVVMSCKKFWRSCLL